MDRVHPSCVKSLHLFLRLSAQLSLSNSLCAAQTMSLICFHFNNPQQHRRPAKAQPEQRQLTHKQTGLSCNQQFKTHPDSHTQHNNQPTTPPESGEPHFDISSSFTGRQKDKTDVHASKSPRNVSHPQMKLTAHIKQPSYIKVNKAVIKPQDVVENYFL